MTFFIVVIAMGVAGIVGYEHGHDIGETEANLRWIELRLQDAGREISALRKKRVK